MFSCSETIRLLSTKIVVPNKPQFQQGVSGDTKYTRAMPTGGGPGRLKRCPGVAHAVIRIDVAIAQRKQWKVVERARLTRSQLERWFQNRALKLVVMEACATAHYWARRLRARGVEIRLLPAKYVRAYVRRNKTDAADTMAPLEAVRASDITPVVRHHARPRNNI